ncbi:MAG: macro domain-containing protein [Bacillota bacterium]|nr:macro domain-containing protein [Eubacteriales bacterium]MDD3536886.1 macro domain-containing protein [Eubacteriales bacterium]MDI9491459.1 macro domain-containing protein [Bacillota bacterium]NLV69276.1 macro domain-containing protein [Clostridiales bacterium]
MPLEIMRNDITKLQVDAIVNAANSHLRQGGGVCGAIFAAAGPDRMQAACDRIGYCAIGDAVITDGFDLPAKYVIHTAGPVWQGGNQGEEKHLASCYTSALQLALDRDLSSIAFPLISSGIFGYPKDQALGVAISAIGNFLLKHDMDVTLVVFDRAAYTLSDKLFRSIKTYVDDRYVEQRSLPRDRSEAKRERLLSISVSEHASRYEETEETIPSPSYLLTAESLSDVVNHKSDSFSQMLFRLIDLSGKSDPEIYKRANLDRRLFSKIRSNRDYKPSKNTALALAIALELNCDRTADLLQRAGYALSPSSRFDLIVEFFINNGNFNIFEINEALFAFDETLLGA